MKIEIESDVHDIVCRLKELDEAYFVVFNTDKKTYEVHNKNQADSYCLTVPFDCLDSRVVDMVCATNVRFADKIYEDIDRNNKIIEENNERRVQDIVDYKTREIFKFANNSSKDFDVNVFENNWR